MSPCDPRESAFRFFYAAMLVRAEVRTQLAGFAAALTARSTRLGLPGNVAVASSRDVAHIAARQIQGLEQTCILPPGEEATFLAPLPIDVFDPGDLGLPCAEFDQLRDLLELESLELPPAGREAELLQGSPDEAARQLATVLKEKGGVL